MCSLIEFILLKVAYHAHERKIRSTEEGKMATTVGPAEIEEESGGMEDILQVTVATIPIFIGPRYPWGPIYGFASL